MEKKMVTVEVEVAVPDEMTNEQVRELVGGAVAEVIGPEAILYNVSLTNAYVLNRSEVRQMFGAPQ